VRWGGALFFAALCGGLFGQNVPDIVWRKSLLFDTTPSEGEPLPVSTMNLAAHKGWLFAGMGTDFEENAYSGHSASVYARPNAHAEWRLDADFGPGTARVGAMFSVCLRHCPDGKPIPEGPVERLVVGTIKMRRAGEPSPLQVWVRDDQTGK
jgi:hypothetical protein